MEPTLSDLRYLYFGGAADAEYDFLKGAADLGITAGEQMEAYQRSAWEKIDELTLGVASPSLDIAGIDQTYKTLKAFANIRGDQAAAFVAPLLNLNNDAVDANYFRQHLQGNAAAASAAESVGAANSRQVGLVPAGTAPANHWGQLEITIVNYTKADRFKVVDLKCASTWGVASGNVLTRHVTVMRNSIQAINRLALAAAGGNWIAGSELSIYGAKSAFG